MLRARVGHGPCKDDTHKLCYDCSPLRASTGVSFHILTASRFQKSKIVLRLELGESSFHRRHTSIKHVLTTISRTCLVHGIEVQLTLHAFMVFLFCGLAVSHVACCVYRCLWFSNIAACPPRSFDVRILFEFPASALCAKSCLQNILQCSGFQQATVQTCGIAWFVGCLCF